MQGCHLIVAESVRMAERWLRDLELPSTREFFYLDNISDRDKQQLHARLKQGQREALQVCLFSDAGMPILFDPGVDVLRWARDAKYEIRSMPTATSWGSAAALSGFAPPFLLVGFPPQKTEEREVFFQRYKKNEAHLILMETPYRYRKLLDEGARTFGADRNVFLAWELANAEEKLFWGTFAELISASEKLRMKKGEFILIVGKV